MPPTLRVEFAFGVDSLTVPGINDWTDVSELCRGVDTSGGRSHELSRSQAGTATIKLKNTDRRFDPTHSASPYWPNLVPDTQVRVISSHGGDALFGGALFDEDLFDDGVFDGVFGGVDYPRFYGYVEDWGQQWSPMPMNSYGDAECVVRAVDGFKLLSLFQVSGSGIYEDAVLGSNPVDYWRLEEVAGVLTALDAGSGLNDLTVTPAQVTFAFTPSPVLGVDGVANFLAVGNAPLRKTSATGWNNGPVASLSLEMFVNPDAYPSAGNTAGLLSINDGTTAAGHGYLVLEDDGALTYSLLRSGTTHTFSTTAGFLTVGTWSHVAFSRVGGNISWYRDGALIETATGVTNSDNGGTAAVTICVGSAEDEATPYFDGKLAHVALYQSVELTPAEIAAHYAAKLQAGFTDVAGSQIDTILDIIGWPTALRDIDTGGSEMSPLELSGSALDLMLHIAEDSEQGLLQMTLDGKVVFHSRNALQTEHATVVATFGDTTSSVAYDGLRLSNDDQDLWTQVIAQRTGGEPQVAGTGVRVLSKTGLNLATDEEVGQFAAYQWARYRDPHTRPVTVTFPATVEANWPLLLARTTHHDRVELIRTPPGGGSPIILDGHVEGMSWRIVPPYNWAVSFSLVPALSQSYWVLGTSALGTATVLGW